jgi:hypothetical protein
MGYEEDEQTFTSNLSEFTQEAHQYIENLHDLHAKRFALRYTVYLQAKARRMPQSEPGTEPGLSGPDRSLIRIFLRRLYKQYFRHRRSKPRPPDRIDAA